MTKERSRLNYHEKLRRSLYEFLRDELERRLIKIALIDSFSNFEKNRVHYTFLDKSELKPKSKKMEKESDLINTFIVIFCESAVSRQFKNHIRFFPENRVVKDNLEYLADFSLYKRFHNNLKHFDNPRFLNLIESLIDVDYALLVQQNPTVKKKNRYSLTHFHVKVDWPIADAAESLAKTLRYVQSHLYENGDKEGRLLQRKLFEYYGCHYSVGGRRTAGLIAAELLRRQDAISTVYVSSSESRAMYKYSEHGVSKFFLIQFTRKQIEELAQKEEMKAGDLINTHLYPAGRQFVGVFEAVYTLTPHSMPPEDGRLRRLKPAYNWLKLADELLHPKTEDQTARPVGYQWIYTP
ncbi:MAG: hypothetical protein JRK53_16185 [Deltaproteobacteria bacterium]|nr:hypothetical protein [Deltaproteobacteria bacterium]